MKYVYVKNRLTLDVARHELDVFNSQNLGEACLFKEGRLIKISDIPEITVIPYQEYRVAINGKIQAQREILDQEYTRYQKAYYEAMKELRAKELPIDEVTE